MPAPDATGRRNAMSGLGSPAMTTASCQRMDEYGRKIVEENADAP
jgi:hypothetical protein